MKVVCFKVPDSFKEVLEKEAKARGVSVSHLIRNAVWAYLTSHPVKTDSDPSITRVRVYVE